MADGKFRKLQIAFYFLKIFFNYHLQQTHQLLYHNIIISYDISYLILYLRSYYGMLRIERRGKNETILQHNRNIGK